jgi:signal transduction histidine kinase
MDVTPEECPFIVEGEEELYTLHKRRVIEKCLECPRIAADLKRLQEERVPFSDTLSLLITEFQDQKARLNSMGSFLSSRTREIKFLHELGLVLQTSLGLDEILSIALTAITAGKGFGMNRAFLLMTDKERHCLRGHLGIGPRNYEEAWQIWQEIDQNKDSLTAMARNFLETKLTSEKAKFHDILEKLSVPLDDHGHIFNRALSERKPILVTDAFHNPAIPSSLAWTLGVDSFLVMPLISRNRRIGVIVADNCITHKEITPNDMQSLEIFAFPVAFALERASLYERAQEDLEKLTAANQKLKEQQDLIVRMEKMALVGRITSSIAHSIRNPLMVIGGFARSLLKDIAESDPKRGYLESIVKEARQLEDVLEEVLNYSDSLYPAKDVWDVNLLVSAVCRELQGEMERHSINCSIEPAPGLPMAYIDYKQIAFCIRSILGSSVATLPRGGTIQVKTVMEEGDVVVDITDTARDIPSAAMDAMSTPFSATQELGSGSALSLCKTILDKNGLPFDMATTADGGRRFILRLPAKKEEARDGKDTGSG